MKHAFRQKVFYADTDAYGVVWHGTYLRWLEAGRIYFCEKKTGYNLSELEKRDIILPVAQIDIKYKNSAKLNEEILINTEILEKNRCSIIFHQTITNLDHTKTYIDAAVKVVAIKKSGTLYRSLPEEIANI